MSFPPPELASLAKEVSALLVAQNATLALAETSCGGLIGATLLATPGASRFFLGGTVSYSLPARKALNGFKTADFDDYDGPTEAIVLRLARSVQSSLGATWAVGESGVCGPTLSPKYRAEIEVGYAPIAVVGPDGIERTRVVRTGLVGEDTRGANMVAFAVAMLELLKSALLERAPGSAKA